MKKYVKTTYAHLSYYPRCGFSKQLSFPRNLRIIWNKTMKTKIKRGFCIRWRFRNCCISSTWRGFFCGTEAIGTCLCSRAVFLVLVTYAEAHTGPKVIDVTVAGSRWLLQLSKASKFVAQERLFTTLWLANAVSTVWCWWCKSFVDTLGEPGARHAKAQEPQKHN